MAIWVDLEKEDSMSILTKGMDGKWYRYCGDSVAVQVEGQKEDKDADK